MEIQCSKRLKHFQTGIFADLNERQLKLAAEGRKIYNLSVGTPDFKPAQHIVDAISQAAMEPENYKYSLRDLPEMLIAVKDYYRKRFGVEVTTDEITSVDGTQEGMGHLGMALTSPGDIALLPNPGYPIFEAGAYLGGAELYFYPLLSENDFQPDFSQIPEDIARKAKFLVLSYPYNPVCRTAREDVYREAIAFARKYNVIIIHDNAYSDIIFDGKTGGSFLQYEGAKEVGAEFFSLSKSFNVTGCRISFLVGNQKIIDAMKLLRSQYNFGMFLPVQYGAIAALTGPLDFVKEQCKKYQKRRNALCGGLRRIGWNVPDSEGTMFVWAKIPAGYKSSREFCMALMEKSGVVCTPGDSFGSLGEGYVRFALVLPTYELEEAVDVINESGVLRV